MIDIDNPWSNIYDQNTSITPAERSMIDVVADGLMTIPVSIISDMWSPETVPARFLPLVAFNYSVNLYEGDFWSEDAKRDWIGRNYEFLARRGTIWAVRRALSVSGYELQQYIRKPQGFYASADITPEQWKSYLSLLPQIRLSFGPRKGSGGLFFFCGDFATSDEVIQGYCGVDDGKALLGRYGYILQDGVKRDLVNFEEVRGSEAVNYSTVERMSSTGNVPIAWFEGDYSDDDKYIDAPGQPDPQIISFTVDRTYTKDTSKLLVSVATTDLQPIEALRPDIDTDIGQANCAVFSDDAASDIDYCGEDDGRYLMVQRTYLFDPKVPIPEVLGYSYSDNDWSGLTPRTTIAMVDLKLTIPDTATVSDETFAGDHYALGDDRSHIDRACRAVEAARGHADQVLVDFSSKRPLQAGDPIGENVAVGEWIKNYL